MRAVRVRNLGTCKGGKGLCTMSLVTNLNTKKWLVGIINALENGLLI